jgi:hypothetical protein
MQLNKELLMSELARFRPGLVRCQSLPFDFERASVALISVLRLRSFIDPAEGMRREWRDPVAFWDAH